MSVQPRFALTLALVAPLLVIALSACGPAQPFDPLAATTPFAFEIDNPYEIEGAALGVLLYPFETIPYGTAATERYGALLNGFIDATLDEDGAIAGSLIAPRDVPRINDIGGWYGGKRGMARSGPWFGDWLLFPPADCPLTATNAEEATFAAMQGALVWDGETFDVEGLPVPVGYVQFGTSTFEDNGPTWTWTFEETLLVMSRAAWSASSDGPCTFETWADITLDIDIEMDVGWQLLHRRVVETHDGVTTSVAETVRTVALEDGSDLSGVWSVHPAEY